MNKITAINGNGESDSYDDPPPMLQDTNMRGKRDSCVIMY